MDENLLPLSYFSLKTSKYKELFFEDKFVWHALYLIEEYCHKFIKEKKFTHFPSNVFLENEKTVSIGEGTIIEPGAFIRGPCIIGNDCVIRNGAYIRGNVIIGNRCVIGHATEVKDSIILDGSSAAHFAYIGNSIIGKRVNLGAGVKCANFRLDHKPVIVRYNEQKFETNLLKFGSIIGDDSQIGCNCVMNPGTLLQKRVKCFPLLTLQGFISSNSVIKHFDYQKEVYG